MTPEYAPEISSDELVRIEVLRTGTYPIVALHGELDLSNAKLLRESLSTVANAPVVAIDLSELSFIDSTGLSAIAQFGKRINDAGGTLYLVITRPVVRKVFTITSLDQHFPVVERLEDISLLLKR